MNRTNPLPTDFREGDRVRVVVDSPTAPDWIGEIGTVGKPDSKYQEPNGPKPVSARGR